MARRNRFVQPNTLRLDLSEGDWIEIHEQLTFAEQQRLTGAMLRSINAQAGDREVGIDWARYSVLKLETWLVDWSFRDAADKPVELDRSAIEMLDAGTAREIEEAIDAHLADLGKAIPVTANGTT